MNFSSSKETRYSLKASDPCTVQAIRDAIYHKDIRIFGLQDSVMFASRTGYPTTYCDYISLRHRFFEFVTVGI